MRKIKSICLLACLCLLPVMGVTASAKGEKVGFVTETSRYSVEYGREVEKDREDQCEVYIAVPWEFSETIPKAVPKAAVPEKEEYHPVQTGDCSGMGWYVVLMMLSALGICGITRKQKENSK